MRAAQHQLTKILGQDIAGGGCTGRLDGLIQDKNFLRACNYGMTGRSIVALIPDRCCPCTGLELCGGTGRTVSAALKQAGRVAVRPEMVCVAGFACAVRLEARQSSEGLFRVHGNPIGVP